MTDASSDKDKVVDVVEEFERRLKDRPTIAIAIAAIQALIHVVEKSDANTLMGLQIELQAAADKLKACNKTSISLAAGCELFSRYVTRTALDAPDFSMWKEQLLKRGQNFAQMSMASRAQIALLADRFISNGKVILVHGFSRVVQTALLHAAKNGKFFSVIVTEGRPESAGKQAAAELSAAGIPVTVILDAAVGYSMSKVDYVLVGAEAVVENGGIINKIGTFQVAMCAKQLKKPVYVATESYKFARLYPIGQDDLPESKSAQPAVDIPEGLKGVSVDSPNCDFTPPQYITLLFTDLGVLTPSAVSDELIKLYS